MKYKFHSWLVIFLFLTSFGTCQSQEKNIIRDSQKVPSSVLNQLKLESLDKDHIEGTFTDTLNTEERSIYSYQLSLNGNRLQGKLTAKIECDNCLLERNEWNYYLDVPFVYCCKDKRHEPSEIALTEEEMKKIQKENGCKVIGICLM